MENKHILKSTYIFAGLFLMLMGYFSYYLAVKSDENMNNSYNKLVDKLSEQTIRGNIYSNDGTVLAETKRDNLGKEYRYYPYDNLFCHTVGSLANGKYGLESMYNYQLLSSDFSWVNKILTDVKGNKYEGNNLLTTLDIDIQKASYDALEGYTGAVVVMEADTGKVLSMVSNPSYNPNKAVEEWDLISKNENSPILNRATMGLYTPGSIFKTFTLETFLEAKKDVETFHFECKGKVSVLDKTIKCANGKWHGNLDLKQSFAKSCNGSFIQIGNSVPVSSLSNVCERMLFNEDLPLLMPYKKSKFTLEDADDEFLKSQTYFGQGETLVTPIHMCLISAAIANKGVLMEPMFVEKIENAYGATIEAFEPKKYRELLSEEEAETLSEYMRAVVTEGTATKLNNYKQLTAYGKTGTAQIEDGKLANSWFMGYAKGNEKTYAIAIVCEKVSSDAAPATNIADEIFKALDK